MNKQYLKIGLLILIVLSLNASLVNSATFSVGVNICAPDWYCTSYSQGSCGTRSCVDINSCGTNYGKPIEYLACPENGGGGGGSSGVAYIPTEILPRGYFTTNYDFIKLIIEQNQVQQKIISINSSSAESYNLEIKYPSSYTKGTEFLTTTSNSKNIDSVGDFNIIIDSRDIIVGTYIIPIVIYNNYKSKEISVVIDVVPGKNLITDIIIDSKIKTLGVDKELGIYVETRGNSIKSGDKIIYSIMDPRGNTLYTSENDIDDPKNIREQIKIPLELTEGYYTLSTKIESANSLYVKSTQFTLLTPNKYYPIIQKPKNINLFNIIISIAVLIIIGFIIYNKIYSDTISSRRFRSEVKWKKENIRTKFIDLKIKEKIGKMANVFIKKNKSDITNKTELLKQSYEKGYITLKEYNDGLNSEGYHVGTISSKSLVKESPHIVEHAEHKKPEEHHHENHTEKHDKEIEVKTSKETIKEENLDKKEKTNDNNDNIKSVLDYVKEELTIHKLNELKKIENILDKKTTDQAFILNNGEKLHSVSDLLKALPQMPEHVFNHHITTGRNDFANWIGDVFKYSDIAEDVRKVKSKEEVIKAIKKYE